MKKKKEKLKIAIDEKRTKGMDFKIKLDDIPNGQRKPVETCKFLRKMQTWREESSHSDFLIY